MKTKLLLVAALAAWPVAATAEDAPICADRPSKSTGTCTVPDGHLQVETAIVDWARDRSGDERSDLTAIGASLIKYGLGDRADVELGAIPLAILSVHDGGEHRRTTGFGDVFLRVKYRVTKEDAPVEIALDPFVKLPTAKHDLGNGKVEGGLVVPISASLGKSGLTLTLDPEFDIRADEDGHGRHLAMAQVANLGFSVTDRLTISGELWRQWDWDDAGTAKQLSADGSIAYVVNNNLQIDAGANFGLSSETPDVEVYSGVSVRF